MLRELIQKYGKAKINTLTKYPSILTLHNIGERGVLLDTLTTDIQGEYLYATEKIDGTNVRIILYGNEYLIGARETILHYYTDLYYDTDINIVDNLYKLAIPSLFPKNVEQFTVIYGELFGGNIGPAKQYGKDAVGFRVFDIAVYNELESILEMPIERISSWREREADKGIIYGQNFLDQAECESLFPQFNYVPAIPFNMTMDLSHETVLNSLKKFLPETNVALTDKALKRPEGVVLRNGDRSKIVKVRYEDYERTLRSQQNIKS